MEHNCFNASRFIFRSVSFNFCVCSMWWIKLAIHVSFLLHVKYTVSYLNCQNVYLLLHSMCSILLPTFNFAQTQIWHISCLSIMGHCDLDCVTPKLLHEFTDDTGNFLDNSAVSRAFCSRVMDRHSTHRQADRHTGCNVHTDRPTDTQGAMYKTVYQRERCMINQTHN